MMSLELGFPGPGDLTEDELSRICSPLTQTAARIRFLKALGVHATRTPGNKVLCSRKHYEDQRACVSLATHHRELDADRRHQRKAAKGTP